MKGFSHDGSGRLRVEFTEQEATLIRVLIGQLIEMLTDHSSAESGTIDPAVGRLLPDAYPDDEEASAEFRRFTETGLADRKVLNAQTVVTSLDDWTAQSPAVSLDEPAAQAWLRTLTDLRLTLAVRLGIEKDGDAGRRDAKAFQLHDVYDWLGFVQESLVQALDRR